MLSHGARKWMGVSEAGRRRGKGEEGRTVNKHKGRSECKHRENKEQIQQEHNVVSAFKCEQGDKNALTVKCLPL